MSERLRDCFSFRLVLGTDGLRGACKSVCMCVCVFSPADVYRALFGVETASHLHTMPRGYSCVCACREQSNGGAAGGGGGAITRRFRGGNSKPRNDASGCARPCA